jgi:hypothetical protein
VIFSLMLRGKIMQNDRVFLLSPHRARQNYLLEHRHPLVHSVAATVFRTGIKEPHLLKGLERNVQDMVVVVVVGLHVKQF